MDYLPHPPFVPVRVRVPVAGLLDADRQRPRRVELPVEV